MNRKEKQSSKKLDLNWKKKRGKQKIDFKVQQKSNNKILKLIIKTNQIKEKKNNNIKSMLTDNKFCSSLAIILLGFALLVEVVAAFIFVWPTTAVGSGGMKLLNAAVAAVKSWSSTTSPPTPADAVGSSAVLVVVVVILTRLWLSGKLR